MLDKVKKLGIVDRYSFFDCSIPFYFFQLNFFVVFQYFMNYNHIMFIIAFGMEALTPRDFLFRARLTSFHTPILAPQAAPYLSENTREGVLHFLLIY